MSTRNRLVVIQLDSIDHEFLNANIQRFPNLSRLVQRGGGMRPLKTEPFAGSTHTSFNTGRSPRDHGVYFQLQWDADEMRLRSFDPGWIGAMTPFWWRGKLGTLKGIVIDPYFTLPDPKKTHLEILGWSSHSSIVPYQCSDEAEGERIASSYPRNPIGNETQLPRGVEARAEERDRMIESARIRGELIRDLAKRHDWDFIYAVFGEPHRGGHVLWPVGGRVPKNGLIDVMSAVDTALGETLDALPDDIELVLCTVQGMGHQTSQSHFCRPLLETALSAMGHSQEQGAPPGFVAWLRKTVPLRLQWQIRHMIPLRLRDRIVAREYTGGVVPGKTIAFPLRSDNHGYWRMLVKGREAHGTLDEDEAQQFREAFAEILLGFRTSDGDPLVSKVLFPSIGGGERAHLLPDIAAAWNTEIQLVSEVHHPTLGTIRATPDDARTGNHRFHAFYVHVGKAHTHPEPQQVSDLPAFIEALCEGAR